MEWLQTKYFMIAKDEPQEDLFIQLGYSSYIDISKLLAEFFDIDLDKIEEERKQMINDLKSTQQ